MDIKRKMCFAVTDGDGLCMPIYRHTIKIRTNWGSTTKYLIFDIYTFSYKDPFTLDTLKEFVREKYNNIYRCASTGNIVDGNNVTTGICLLTINANSVNWTGINSSGDEFTFYIQPDLSDIVQEVK